jgi:diguanylate cyclase (GGDEF)-like protein
MLIAGQLAVSLDNALLYDSLERKVAARTEDLNAANLRLKALSSTDPLTGLANRRRFNDMIEAEWRRAIRPQTPIAVAMIDIDQFKLYNDQYGHPGGDECLRRVARALGESIRGGTDLVARYGGEEFVIVLPGADLEAMHQVAERARAAVEALREPREKSNNGIVTISVGIATLVPTEHNDAAQLIELADAALYRAKKKGRNQVVARKGDDLPEPEPHDQLPPQGPHKPRLVH